MRHKCDIYAMNSPIIAPRPSRKIFKPVTRKLLFFENTCYQWTNLLGRSCPIKYTQTSLPPPGSTVTLLMQTKHLRSKKSLDPMKWGTAWTSFTKCLRTDKKSLQTPRNIVEEVNGDIRNAPHGPLRIKTNHHLVLLRQARPTIRYLQGEKTHQDYQAIHLVNRNDDYADKKESK